VSSRGLKQGQRLLSIEEVREAGLPAVLCAFGDHLAYVGGTIYALPRELDPCELADLPGLSGAYEVTHVVGIEYGWRHLEGGAPAAVAEVPREAA
jgi:hypothetical protein